MKAFTDLEQSKKLAEILPLESADNVIVSFGSREGTKTVVMTFETLNTIRTPFSDIRKVVPCWSLAALLNVLPRIDIEKEIWTDDTFDYRVKAYIGDGYAGDWFDNPVDSCVNMVIKLHEQKLL